MIAPKITNGDLEFVNANVIWLKDDDELIQSIESDLKTRLGEFFLEEDTGLSRENIRGKNFDPDLIRDDIIEAIMQKERIESVENIEVVDDRVKRKRVISFSLTKKDGEVLTVEGVEI